MKKNAQQPRKVNLHNESKMQKVHKQEHEPTRNQHIARIEQLHKTVQKYHQKLPEEAREIFTQKTILPPIIVQQAKQRILNSTKEIKAA